jgi:hypothetical protein
MDAPLKIPSRLDRRAALVGLGLFASVFLLAGLAMGYFVLLRPWLESRAAQSWMETPCRIISSEVKSHAGGKSTTYSVDITYQYQVTGQTLRSNRYDFTLGSSSGYDGKAIVVRENPAGKDTVCYVNPQNPAEAVLSRSFENNALIWIGPLIFSLVGLGMLIPVGLGAVRRVKFGDSVFELDDAPVPIGGVLEGTVTFDRMIRPMDGFAVKLVCIHRIVTGAGKSQNVQEIPLWEDKQQVMSDTGATVPISFALPEDGTETSAASRRDRIFWRLDVSAKVPGIGYRAQFEVPVAKAELSAAAAVEARQLRAAEAQADAQYQLPAHSRIRVQDTGGGKEFYFPAMRNFGLVFSLTFFTAIWTAICWVLIHFGAPLLFPIVFCFFDALLLLFWVNACFGTSQVTAGNGEIILTKHLFGLGRTKTIPATEIREISVSIGASMGTQVFYNVQIVRRNGMKQTAGAGVADSHEAHWLALEMAKCAGVGR